MVGNDASNYTDMQNSHVLLESAEFLQKLTLSQEKLGLVKESSGQTHQVSHDVTEQEYLEKVTHQIDNMAYLSMGIDKLLTHFEGKGN